MKAISSSPFDDTALFLTSFNGGGWSTRFLFISTFDGGGTIRHRLHQLGSRWCVLETFRLLHILLSPSYPLISFVPVICFGTLFLSNLSLFTATSNLIHTVMIAWIEFLLMKGVIAFIAKGYTDYDSRWSY
ncbi:hypothetical protein RIF29_24856 [Crotalaria pallida]|uniref:Uncharacterized protein n=1 Tax=Crotalaria pallida TaxID=3830 RepID=A0AAN9HZA2_CROPI